MPKTKARMSEYVGEERKSSWSRGERIRRIGMLNCTLSSAGGSGNEGVSGAGSEGTDDEDLRWRGTSLGSSRWLSEGNGTVEVAILILSLYAKGQSRKANF